MYEFGVVSAIVSPFLRVKIGCICKGILVEPEKQWDTCTRRGAR